LTAPPPAPTVRAMRPDGHPRARALRAAAEAAAWIGLAAVGWLAAMHARMVASPAPQEMREGAVVWITGLMLQGRNPWDPAELPASANVYGAGYHLAVLPVAALFGNGFEVHRAVSAAAILGAAAILWLLMRRQGADRLAASVGAAVFYLSSLYFVAPLARPDGLAVLLSLASLAVVVVGRYRVLPFAVGLALAMGAFATKLYLAYPPFALGAYVFLYVSRVRGLAYLAASGAAAAATLLALTVPFPAYVEASVFANAGSAAYDVRHLLEQTGDWLLFSLPLTAAMAALLLGLRRIPDPRTPPDPYAFVAALGFLVYLALLGGHPGAHMTYLFQLVTPALVVAVVPRLAGRPAARAAALAALPVAVAWMAPWFPWSFETFRRGEDAFAAVAAALEGRGEVLGSTEAAGVLALAGRPVTESGQSEYFGGIAAAPRLPVLPVPDGVLAERWEAFRADIRAGLEARRYDLVIRSRRPGGVIPEDLLAGSYRVSATVPLLFAWTGQAWPVDLWEPRPPE